ncbi:hypothetical protein Back11_35890 [Paenibacillus baekrokdamisoli]|uniref:Uncharacterized protein n=1 Tax=Paenibacillus baekrokdamisoli TaxID=1712516 RepID=A0A3G9JGH8_9BACL|nr:response regulator [Paenibacillus baekrokdamisoli]MBB3070816.1 YesN/AraC family two-component response regulator [Paenibacillus baekrokdamisoli]BBH22244.1 hypothetical protein Back11_35890 [Paenibacillus baekrokdamisoli]
MSQTVKLLLVDDEPLALRRIRSFGLAAHGFEIVGEAENGVQALQYVERLKPDIVITDIGMPVMDGLELLQQIQQQPSPPKVVLLTCYEDFGKVQRALRFGAGDYLTKVMLSEEEFVGVLQRTAASIRKEHMENELLVRVLLQELLLSPSEQVLMNLKQAGFAHDIYAITLIRTARRMQEEWMEELADAGRSENQRSYILIRVTPDIWCFYCYSIAREGDTSFYSWYNSTCSRIGDWLRNNGGMEDYAIGASGVYRRLSDLPGAYQQGLALCDAGFYADPGEMIRKEERIEFAAFPPERFRIILAAITSTVGCKDGEELAAQIQAWSDLIGTVFYPAPSQVRQMALAILSQLESFEWEHQEEAGMNKLLARFKQTVDSTLHASILIREMRGLASVLMKRQPNASGSMRKEIKEATRWIAVDFAHIDLTETAKRVNLSPSWFAALFRMETGKSFHDYVQEVRLNQAKELLRGSDLKVYEIAEQVGIPNSRYFSRLFSEFTSSTPLDYRKNERVNRADDRAENTLNRKERRGIQ